MGGRTGRAALRRARSCLLVAILAAPSVARAQDHRHPAPPARAPADTVEAVAAARRDGSDA